MYCTYCLRSAENVEKKRVTIFKQIRAYAGPDPVIWLMFFRIKNMSYNSYVVFYDPINF